MSTGKKGHFSYKCENGFPSLYRGRHGDGWARAGAHGAHGRPGREKVGKPLQIHHFFHFFNQIRRQTTLNWCKKLKFEWIWVEIVDHRVHGSSCSWWWIVLGIALGMDSMTVGSYRWIPMWEESCLSMARKISITKAFQIGRASCRERV